MYDIFQTRENNCNVNLEAPTPRNYQTHLKNLSAIADKFFSVFDHFVELVLKGLRSQTDFTSNV